MSCHSAHTDLGPGWKTSENLRAFSKSWMSLCYRMWQAIRQSTNLGEIACYCAGILMLSSQKNLIFSNRSCLYDISGSPLWKNVRIVNPTTLLLQIFIIKPPNINSIDVLWDVLSLGLFHRDLVIVLTFWYTNSQKFSIDKNSE